MRFFVILFIVVISSCSPSFNGISFQELETIFQKDKMLQHKSLLNLGFYQKKRSNNVDYEIYEKSDISTGAIQVPIDERITIYDHGQITYWARSSKQIEKLKDGLNRSKFNEMPLKDRNGTSYQSFEDSEKTIIFQKDHLMLIPKK